MDDYSKEYFIISLILFCLLCILKIGGSSYIVINAQEMDNKVEERDEIVISFNKTEDEQTYKELNEILKNAKNICFTTVFSTIVNAILFIPLGFIKSITKLILNLLHDSSDIYIYEQKTYMNYRDIAKYICFIILILLMCFDIISVANNISSVASISNTINDMFTITQRKFSIFI